jgi:hypothetical protein
MAWYATNVNDLTLEPLSLGSQNPLDPFPWARVTGAAFADGLLAGLPVVEAISHIDPSVLKAIEASTADHIHSFPSVHSYVEQHFFAVPALSADGWFERLTGYVAEQKAASALEAAGHHVTFAATANQPVWDLLVDGHPVQVKEGLTGVRSFLLEHHGIPVLTSHEVAIAAKDPMVHGLQGLSSTAIHESTRHSIDGISDAFDPGFHFPIITLAFSGFREANLFFQERTTFGKAVMHVGLDVAGVGAGALAGSHAGAFAGAFLGPIGAAVGGLIGAVVGGVGGKLLSTGIRYAPFNLARATYEKTVDSAKAEIDMAVDSSKGEVLRLQSTCQSQFVERRAQIERHAAGQLRDLVEAYDIEFLAFAENFCQHLDELTGNLRQQEELVLATLPAGWLRGFLFPTHNDYLRSAIRIWFRRARKTLAREKKQFRQLQPRTLDTVKVEIQRFLNTYEFKLESLHLQLRHFVRTLEEIPGRAEVIAIAAGVEVQCERDSLIGKFAVHVEHLHSQLVGLIQSWNSKISIDRDSFKREGQSLGIDL